jgi:hypothetical protein
LKLHRRVALLEVSDRKIIDALEKSNGWAAEHLVRVSETAVAVPADHVESLAERLRSLGYLPRVVER